MFKSPEAANLWFDIFNGVLLTGAFLVAVGTWGTIKTASIKERFSDERVSTNELETRRAVADSDTAKEGTAKAHERIAELSTLSAEANARALEAQAQLARYRARRTMWSEATPAGFAKMNAVSDRLRASFSGMKWDAASVPYDPKSTLLLREVQHLLARSAWQQTDWPEQGTRDWPEAKTVGLYGGAGLAVTITSIEKSPKIVVDAANELAKALHELGISSDPSIVQMPDISSADAVHVLVGKKRM